MLSIQTYVPYNLWGLRSKDGLIQVGGIPEETHLNFLLDKKENQAKFVASFLRIVWVERNSLMIVNLRGVSESPLCMNIPKI